MAALSQQVLAFARRHLGRKVGRGECWDLADAALEAAGAKCSHDFGRVTRSANYRWGLAINLSQANAGDIIQIRDFKWTRRVTKRDARGTSWKEDSGSYTQHTAILARSKGHGLWEVYEQNFENRKFVTNGSTYLKAGKFKNSRGDEVEIKITGRFWIYRAQPR